MKKQLQWWVLGVLVLVNIFVWQAVLHAGKYELTVAFLNVGQGDAIFIESPTGTQVLVDGGAGKQVLRELGSVMPLYDRSLDIVIATHPDADHIGGLPDVLERYRVTRVFESGNTSETDTFEAFEEALGAEGAERLTAQRGQVIDIGGGAYMRVLFPDRDVSRIESNDASIVLQVVYGETEVLLTGDASQAVENYVASLEGKKLASDILKAGHHGSRTSSSETFVGWASPSYAVISAGCGNRYGHPHKEVLETLERFEIKMLSTCESGRVIFTSDGDRPVLK